MKALKNVFGSPLFWKLLFVPIAGVILFFGYQHFIKSGNETPSNITVVTSGNAQQVQTDISNSKVPVFFELCTPDICSKQNVELEKVAAEYKGKVMVVEVNPFDVPDLEQSAASIIGQTVFPSHMLMTQTGATAVGGLKTADELKAFIDSSLSSKVLRVTQANAQEVQAAITKANLPVLYVLCTPDLCAAQNDALEAAATKYQGKALIVVVNPLEADQLAQSVAQQLGVLAYPSYLFVNSNGATLPTAGLMDADTLGKLIEAGLQAKPQTDTTSGAGTGTSNNTGGSTAGSSNDSATAGSSK